jgi:hypothetical protein
MNLIHSFVGNSTTVTGLEPGDCFVLLTWSHEWYYTNSEQIIGPVLTPAGGGAPVGTFGVNIKDSGGVIRNRDIDNVDWDLDILVIEVLGFSAGNYDVTFSYADPAYASTVKLGYVLRGVETRTGETTLQRQPTTSPFSYRKNYDADNNVTLTDFPASPTPPMGVTRLFTVASVNMFFSVNRNQIDLSSFSSLGDVATAEGQFYWIDDPPSELTDTPRYAVAIGPHDFDDLPSIDPAAELPLVDPPLTALQVATQFFVVYGDPTYETVTAPTEPPTGSLWVTTVGAHVEFEPDAAPTPGSVLSAIATSSTTIDVSWIYTAPENLDGFTIERSLTGYGGWTEIADVGPTVRKHTDTGLIPDTRYYYRVFAYETVV